MWLSRTETPAGAVPRMAGSLQNLHVVAHLLTEREASRFLGLSARTLQK